MSRLKQDYNMLNVEELSLSEKVCHSILRIEATIPPNLTSTGTGFIFSFKVDEQLSIPCLVTNKHGIYGRIGRLFLKIKPQLIILGISD